MIKIVYFLVFLISFLGFFIWSFPIDRIIQHYLIKQNVDFSVIKGNILGIQIKNIRYKDIKVSDLYIKNRFLSLDFLLDRENIISINPLKKQLIVDLNNLDISRYQKQINATITAKGTIKTDKKYILIEGSTQIFLKNSSLIPLSNIRIKGKSIPEKNINKIFATINSSFVNGNFTGKLTLPVDIKQGYLQGTFSGKMYNSNINQNIKINLSNYVKGSVW